MTEQRYAGIRWAAVLGPIAVAYAASLLRDVLTSTSAALVLVLVVVALAVAGDRLAGVLATVSAAASFDFFLTVPYYRFTILDRDDLETAILLLVIGIAVTEICRWGRRQRSGSARRGGYLAGVAHAARMAAEAPSGPDLVGTVENVITEVLDLDRVRYEAPSAGPAPESGRPVLHRDGAVAWGDRVIDVARDGLPTMDTIELPAGRGHDDGRFLLTASLRVRRPDREQLLVAITLAEQVVSTPAADQRTDDE